MGVFTVKWLNKLSHPVEIPPQTVMWLNRHTASWCIKSTHDLLHVKHLKHIINMTSRLPGQIYTDQKGLPHVSY